MGSVVPTVGHIRHGLIMVKSKILLQMSNNRTSCSEMHMGRHPCAELLRFCYLKLQNEMTSWNLSYLIIEQSVKIAILETCFQSYYLLKMKRKEINLPLSSLELPFSVAYGEMSLRKFTLLGCNEDESMIASHSQGIYLIWIIWLWSRVFDMWICLSQAMNLSFS